MNAPTVELGQYRVSLQKRVSEEEHVCIDFLESDPTVAGERLAAFTEVCIRMREQHNERIVAIHTKQLAAIEAKCETKAAELQATQAEVDAARRELSSLTEKVTKIKRRA